MPARVDKAAEVERALTNVYLTLFKEIKKDPDYPDNIGNIKQRFNRKVNDATRAAIAVVYAAGVTYVNNKLKTDPYLTTTDIINQVQETDRAVTAFWKRIQADADRTIQQEDALVVEPKPALNTTSVLNGIAAFATTAALALATTSKVKQITQPLTQSTEDGQVVEFDIGFEIKKTPQLKWITQHDERVCPICRELDGQIWQQDDPDLQQPPDDAHNNCRCYLEIID
jgi:SPP1 gp7 family putative phage head morphogenesis protein